MRLTTTVIAVVSLLGSSAVAASAADPKRGAPVTVTLKEHSRVFDARLVSLDQRNVEVDWNGRRHVFRLEEVLRIEKRPDSLVNGAVIGAAILGGWCALVCGQGQSSEGSAGGVIAGAAALGAAIGAGVDALQHDRGSLYPTASGNSATLANPRGQAFSLSFSMRF